MSTHLTTDGLTVVPLRRVSPDYLLEGWLHYEEGSYRYFRACSGPVRLVLRHGDGEEVPLLLHPDRSPREMEATPFWAAVSSGPVYNLTDVGAAQRAQDTFTEAAVVVQGDGPRPWKFKVHPALQSIPAVEGDAVTRAEAVAEADKVLSKFLVQDVHDDPVDLRAISREIDALRTTLSVVLGVTPNDLRDYARRWGDDEHTVNRSVRIADVRAAFKLLGVSLPEERAAK